MKKTLVLVLLALVMTGCWRAKPKAEPKQSAAKESVWDFYLIGTWQYTEDDSDIKSSFPKGTESFYGDGKYLCHAIDKKGKNVTVEGVWRLDDDEDFVVWVGKSPTLMPCSRRNTRFLSAISSTNTMNLYTVSWNPRC